MWAISTLKRNLSTCPKNCGILSHSWPIWSKRSWFYIWNIFYQNYLDIDTLTSCQGCQNSLLTILRQLNFSEHVFKHNTGHSHLLLQSLCGSHCNKAQTFEWRKSGPLRLASACICRPLSFTSNWTYCVAKTLQALAHIFVCHVHSLGTPDCLLILCLSDSSLAFDN